jgi:hypothetical protein
LAFILLNSETIPLYRTPALNPKQGAPKQIGNEMNCGQSDRNRIPDCVVNPGPSAPTDHRCRPKQNGTTSPALSCMRGYSQIAAKIRDAAVFVPQSDVRRAACAHFSHDIISQNARSFAPAASAPKSAVT